MTTFDVWIHITYPNQKPPLAGIGYSIGTIKLHKNWADNITARKTDFVSFLVKLIKAKKPTEDCLHHILDTLKIVNNRCVIELYSYDENLNEDIVYKVGGLLTDTTLFKNNKLLLVMMPSTIRIEWFFNKEVLQDVKDSNQT